MTLETILNNAVNSSETKIGIFLKNKKEIYEFGKKLEAINFNQEMTSPQKRGVKDSWKSMLKKCESNGFGWFFYNVNYIGDCAWGSGDYEFHAKKHKIKNVQIFKFENFSRKEKLKDL